jgi:predicted Zn-dependent protease
MKNIKYLGIAALLISTGCLNSLDKEDGTSSKQEPFIGSSNLQDDEQNNQDESKKRNHKQIKYDLGCLRDSSLTDVTIGLGSDIEDNIINRTTSKLPIEDEIAVGDTIFEQVKTKYTVLESGSDYMRIKRILQKLLPQIPSPVGFRYKYYVVESDEVNAFTAGGRIFVFTGILKQVYSDDELACILSHEIYHNELGHINKLLRKQEVVSRLMKKKRGKIAGWALLLLGNSFNQDEETLCDLHGVDLAQSVGYRGCSAIHFWNRLSKSESSSNRGKWLRSHPYGKQRMNCIRHHISTNYGIDCPN